MEVQPGILVQNINDFYQQIKTLKPYFKNIHIDIADGVLVPNTTIQVLDIISTIQQFNKLTMNLSFDFHLMVKDYEKVIKEISKLKDVIKINNILIHISVLNNFEKLIAEYPYFSLGIVLDTQDIVEAIRTKVNLAKVPIIQIMTVKAGFQGQSINIKSLDKIEQLRHVGYRNIISIDGGINNETIPIIASLKYRPDRLDGVGSFFSKAKNLEERIEFLKKYNCY